MREAAGQFAPCGDALGLHGAVFFTEQVFGHAVEGSG